MDTLRAVMTGLLAGELQYIAYAAIFLTVFLAVSATGLLLRRDPVRSRLLGPAAPDSDAAAQSLQYRKARTFRLPLIGEVWRHLAPKQENEFSRLRLWLIQAGYYQPWAPAQYFTIRIGLGIGLPAAYLTIAPLLSRELAIEQLMLLGAGLMLAGLYVPPLLVFNRVMKRQQSVRDGFPDALDMLLVCVEAGLGIDAALARVAEEIGRLNPILSWNLNFVGLELRAGRSREQALRGLAERTGLDEINSFVTLLIQSDQLGTSMAQALRVYAEEMRQKRLLRAEEKANKLPTKLAVPLILLILPALLLTVMTPAIIRISNVLLPTLNGTQ